MPETWVQDAVRVWGEGIGLIPHGRMGRALKPLVDLQGWDQVGVWLRTYVALAPVLKRDGSVAAPEEAEQVMLANVKWLSPESFVQHYRVWAKLSEEAGEHA